MVSVAPEGCRPPSAYILWELRRFVNDNFVLKSGSCTALARQKQHQRTLQIFRLRITKAIRIKKISKRYPPTIAQEFDRDNAGILAVAVQDAFER